MLCLVFFASVFATQFSTLEENSATCPAEKGKPGAYLSHLLATFWIGTSCLQDSPKSGVGPVQGTNLVTIHGLWPGNNASSYPYCCNNSYPFKASELGGVTDLSKNWVSTRGSDETFYAHEWEKHGTCAMDAFKTEREYFQQTVNLNKRLNIAGVLRNAGIIPGNKIYQKTDVASALRKGLGHDPLLECATVSGQKMLGAIYVCISKGTSLTVEACTPDYISKYANKCPNQFYLPAIPSSCYK